MDRILVVDDDPLIVQALTRILSSEGFEVVAHTDPVLAAKERNFQVVITDFMMPAINGVELLATLKVEVPDAVRLMLTAADDFRVASDAVNLGHVFRLLAKPWHLPELLSSIRQALAHFHLVRENRRLSTELSSRNAELEALNASLERAVIERTNGLLEGMVAALDYRDTETQWHSRRVSLYSKRIAEQAGLERQLVLVVEQGALLHDIGKIGVRDSILHKPGPLTPEEWVEMRLHPEIGFRILSKLAYVKDAAQIVLQHQERWDGQGYPQGLKGTLIDAGARIFCIADTLDAITSDRPYRKGRSFQVARDEIVRCRGTQFDPDLVDAFVAIPESEWSRIHHEVDALERAEQQRWEGKPLMPLRSRPEAAKPA